MTESSAVACFSDLEVVKTSLLGQGRVNRGRRGSVGRVSRTVSMVAHL